jgi:hypothetical protein
MRYIFKSQNVVYQWEAMIHALAVTAALANRRPVTMLPTLDGGQILAPVTLHFNPAVLAA